jgi:hypothetical protein
MPDDELASDALSSRAFGASFRTFLEQAATGIPAEDSVFTERLRAHLGAEPAGLEVVTHTFSQVDRPNVQVALDAYLEGDGRSAEALGFLVPNASFRAVVLTDLIFRSRPGFFGGPSVQIGPVAHLQVDIGGGRSLTCIESGLLLLTTEHGPVALLVSGDQQAIGGERKIRLQAIAAARATSEQVLADVDAERRRRSVFRGRTISFYVDAQRSLAVRFHDLPKIERGGIILPAGVLERAEAHSIAFAEQAERLLAAGRHLRRGLLLHGPPGTGKTLTAMYIAAQLEDRTTILITGAAMGMIEQSVAFARLLQPSLVILEDVDLVAEERTQQELRGNTVLFELLNQMDGLAEDADVIFLLTTNRPDLLEPALASRPGRVDQAIEIPLPDADCRGRLFELYAAGLELDGVDADRLVERTRGVSAAFIRELLRKAALVSAVEGGDGKLVVSDRHLDEALHDLVVEGGELTKTLLGAANAPAT